MIEQYKFKALNTNITLEIWCAEAINIFKLLIKVKTPNNICNNKIPKRIDSGRCKFLLFFFNMK